MKKEYVSYLIGGLVFICLAALTFWLIFRGFKSAGPLFLASFFNGKRVLLLVAVMLLLYTFDGLRLLFVFKTMGMSVPFLLAIKLVFINIFASGVTPLATGGGFAQIYFLSRNNISVGIASAATTVRTVIASIMIFVLVPVILVLEKGLKSVTPVKHGVVYSLLLIFIYILLVFLLIRNKDNMKNASVWILRGLKRFHLISHERFDSMSRSVETEIELFIHNIKLFWQGRRIFLVLSIFTAGTYLFLLFLFPWILLRMMDVPVHIITVLSIQILITFLIYFTPTPGGSGVAEGGFALIFSHFVSPESVPVLTFYWRFITMYMGMIIGLIIFYKEVWRKDRAH